MKQSTTITTSPPPKWSPAKAAVLALTNHGLHTLAVTCAPLRQLLNLVNPRPLRAAPNSRTDEPTEQAIRDHER